MFLVSGCKERHNKAIDLAYQLSATAPDSALSILNDVKQAKLSKAEMVRYALVYNQGQTDFIDTYRKTFHVPNVNISHRRHFNIWQGDN